MIATLGYLAGFFTTISFAPQVILTLRTRDVEGISLSMYVMFVLGVGLWCAYGVVLHAWPIIVANAITFALAGCVLVMKVRSLLMPRRDIHDVDPAGGAAG